ncbi:MAG: hypothetical protein AAFX55_05980 [Bacteroidota bacterium]
MKPQITLFSMLLLLSMSCKEANDNMATVNNTNAETSPLVINDDMTLTGANVLAFGPENVLFIGDSNNSTLYAVQTEAKALKDVVPYNMESIDLILAEKLNMNVRDLMVNDMKVHPLSQEVYIALKKGHAPEAPSMVAIVNPIGEDLKLLEINASNSTKISIENPASGDYKFWNETPKSALSITDIDYNDGFVYVAGLTNGEFASNLRKIAYPFNGTQDAVNSIEIYHAVHTQMETRAPIRTMLFDELNGESTLIASYTCTPLVTIPTSAIIDNGDVKGKTIAELGYGNAPIDMITVTTQGQDGSYNKSLVVTHKNRGGSLIPFSSIAEAKQMDVNAPAASAPAGLKDMVAIPTATVMHIDNQNQMFIAVLRRNIETGSIDLVSEVAGVYLRLSDFISEYDFPDYKYDEKQAGTKGFHDMIKPMEGYPELTSDKTGK